MGIFPDELSPIGSVVSEILSFIQTDAQKAFYLYFKLKIQEMAISLWYHEDFKNSTIH